MAARNWLLGGNSGTRQPQDFLGTVDVQPLVIRTSNSERLRVDPQGRVGIGTASPAYALHLAAGESLRIEGATSATDTTPYFSFGGNGTLSVDAPGVPGGRFLVTTNGFVGINNNAPTGALDVSPTVRVLNSGFDQRNPDADASVTILPNNAFPAVSISVPVAGGLGPILALSNLGSGEGAAASIDFHTFAGNQSSRIQVIDDGNYGNDFVFWSIAPGNANNSLVERMRITSAAGAQLTGTWYGYQDESQDWQIYLGMADANSTLSVTSNVPGNYGPVLALYNLGGGVNTAAAIDFYTFDPGEGIGPDHQTGPSSEIKAIDVGNYGNDIVFLSNTPGAPNNPLIEQMRITSTGNINVPGDIILTGADCAEHFDVSAEAEPPAPGTVMVLAEGGGLGPSAQAYDRKVVGVVSGAGGYRPALVLDKRAGSTEPRVAIALAGKVFCKVDARYGKVAVGDLLTTSPTPGHAMKATEPDRAFGAIVGKALASLDCDQGLVPIVVALQ
jgi:hypothetical protein